METNSLQGPTQSGATLDTTQQNSVAKLFQDPNFLSLLAGIGSRLDQYGVGGAIGGGTQEAIRAQASQRAAGSLEQKQNTADQQNAEHRKALLDHLGGLTHPQAAGPTKM